MYQLKSNSFTVRLSDEDKDKVNEYFKRLQSENGECDTAKEVFLKMFSDVSAPKQGLTLDPSQKVITITDDLQALIDTATAEIDGVNHETNVSELFTIALANALESSKNSVSNPLQNPMVLDLLGMYRITFDVPEDVSDLQCLIDVLTTVNAQISEEEAKEVLTNDNEVLLSFSEDQKAVLDKINTNRNKRLSESKKEDIRLMLMNMIFNKGNLYNWHGNFYTGLD